MNRIFSRGRRSIFLTVRNENSFSAIYKIRTRQRLAGLSHSFLESEFRDDSKRNSSLSQHEERYLRILSPLEVIQASMMAAHTLSGGPWWTTIVGCTLIFRSLLVPVTILQARTIGQIIAGPAAHHLSLIGRLYRKEMSDVSKRSRATSLLLQGVLGIFRRFKINPIRLVAVPLTQISVLLLYIFATRDLLRDGGLDLVNQGALWFMDLGAKDSTMILPLIAVYSSYMSIELAFGREPLKEDLKEDPLKIDDAIRSITISDIFREFFQGMLVFSIPFIAQLPAGIFMYWIPSSIFGIAQSAALRNNEVRKFLKLPIRIEGKDPRLNKKQIPLVLEAAKNNPVPKSEKT